MNRALSSAFCHVTWSLSYLILWLLPGMACGQATKQDAYSARTVDALLKPTLRRYTLAEVRALTKAPEAPVYIIDNGGGMFRYDPTDSRSPDNTGVCIVTAGGQRLKRDTQGTITLTNFGGGPSVADNSVALQAAINEQIRSGLRIIVDKPGTYRFLKSVSKPQSFTGLSLEGVDGVLFSYSALAPGAAFIRVVGGSGGLTRSEIKNIIFVGNATSTAIELAGQCGQRIVNCWFRTNREGIRFHNDTPGSFTEHCVAEDCQFENACQFPLHYKRTKGDLSMHGSGLQGRNLINTAGTVVLIDDNVLPYNCPLSAQVWVNNANCVLIANTGKEAIKPTFFGQMSLELMTSSASIVLSSGKNPVYFSGPFVTSGDRVSGGNFVMCQASTYKANGTVVTKGARFNMAVSLESGENRLHQSPLKAGNYMVTLHLIGANYDYRYTLLLENEGMGGPGFVTQLANQRAFDVTGWGPPTLAVDSEGQLLITNSKYPKNGVTAYLTYHQIGDWPVGNYPAKSF